MSRNVGGGVVLSRREGADENNGAGVGSGRAVRVILARISQMSDWEGGDCSLHFEGTLGMSRDVEGRRRRCQRCFKEEGETN